MLFFCKKCPDLRYGYKNNYFNIMVYYKDILESRSSFMQIYQNAKNAKPSLHCSHFSFWGISKKVEIGNISSKQNMEVVCVSKKILQPTSSW